MLVDRSIRSYVLIIVTLTAGATLLMWIGELITQRGIGNGMSAADLRLDPDQRPGRHHRLVERLVVREAVAADRDPGVVIFAVVYVQEGIRRIPIQYAKRMVGPADDLGRHRPTCRCASTWRASSR